MATHKQAVKKLNKAAFTNLIMVVQNTMKEDPH